MTKKLHHHTWLLDLTLLTLLTGLVYFITLGVPPLYITDEGRYAEIGREMLFYHDFITPHLNGLPYFEKPPLTYWCISLFEWLFGMNEWAVRSVNAFFALSMCAMVYVCGRICFNRASGIWATLILSSSVLFFTVTHVLTTDTCLTTVLTLALTSFMIWYKLKQSEKSYPAILYLVYAGCALAVLAKGLIGIVFPGLTLFTWLLFTRRWKLLKEMRIFSGLLLFFLIAAPWHILAAHYNPTFYYEYFYINHYLRFVTPIMQRQMDKFVYMSIFFGGFLPWMFFLIWRFKIILHIFLNPRNYSIESFLLWWILSVFLFFSFSDSILIPYLLPVVPPLSLLTAPMIVHLWHKNAPYVRKQLIFLLIATWLILNIIWVTSPLFIGKSTKRLAEQTNELLESHPHAILVNYDYYFNDFPFYTQRLVEIVNWQGELAYGLSVDPENKVMINDTTFWKQVNSTFPLYVVMTQEVFNTLENIHPDKLFLIGQQGKYVLATNQLI